MSDAFPETIQYDWYGESGLLSSRKSRSHRELFQKSGMTPSNWPDITVWRLPGQGLTEASPAAPGR
jgi:hypothetical protein